MLTFVNAGRGGAEPVVREKDLTAEQRAQPARLVGQVGTAVRMSPVITLRTPWFP